MGRLIGSVLQVSNSSFKRTAGSDVLGTIDVGVV